MYPARVIDVKGDGTLVLEYDHGGQGLERVDQVEARIQMPWHPKQRRHKLVIMLRRNVGRGVAIEGITGAGGKPSTWFPPEGLVEHNWM